jgi:simple sugar transport system permease protein
MLNFVATGLIAFLISTDSFGVLRGNNISTQPIAESGQVPGLSFGGSGEIFGLILLSAALGVGYWFLLERTRFGFDLKASGESPTAAAAGGVDARRMVIIALLMSGAVAGLVGLPELLGRDLAYTLNSPAGYGFTGIAIALLGRNHPVGIALGALLWAFLDKSALALDNVGVPREIVLIMQGSIVLSVVVAYEIVRRYELAAEQRRVAAQLRARADEPAGVGQSGAAS